MAPAQGAFDPLSTRKTVSAKAKSRAAHAFTAGCLVVWAAASPAIPEYLAPAPWSVAARMADFVVDPRLAGHALTTLAHVGAALGAAFVVGLVLAMVPYLAPVMGFTIDKRLTPFLNAFSGLGWAMFAVLWFGVTHLSVIFAVSAILLPFSLIGLREGLAVADRELLEMTRSFTRTRRKHLLRVVLPALVPFMMAALRTGFGTAWKVVLVVELIGGNSGFGFVLNLARQQFDSTTLFAVIGLIVAFVYCAERFVFVPLQRRAQRTYGAA